MPLRFTQLEILLKLDFYEQDLEAFKFKEANNSDVYKIFFMNDNTDV